jgi:hypothetical protein
MLSIFLAGWILAFPPNAEDEHANAITRSPFSEWSAIQAFDSASDCEKRRREIQGTFIDAPGAQFGMKNPNPEVSRAYLGGANSALLSRCVPDYVMYPPPPGVTIGR